VIEAKKIGRRKNVPVAELKLWDARPVSASAFVGIHGSVRQIAAELRPDGAPARAALQPANRPRRARRTRPPVRVPPAQSTASHRTHWSDGTSTTGPTNRWPWGHLR
jgi:hypothetical protein